MTTSDTVTCWCVLRIAPRSAHELMKCLNVAGHATFCPTQVVSVTHNGSTKEVVIPLFPGCLFVAGDISIISSLISLQKAAFLVDSDGHCLCIEADKAKLVARFAQLLES